MHLKQQLKRKNNSFFLNAKRQIAMLSGVFYFYLKYSMIIGMAK
jgi:hypothetical protein